MVKKGATTTAPAAAAPAAAPVAEAPKAAAPATTPASTDSGTAAAISRLKKTEAAPAGKPTGRDYNGEARGKTRCVQFQSALMSPAIAGMKFDTMEQYLALCKQAADFGTDYTFSE